MTTAAIDSHSVQVTQWPSLTQSPHPTSTQSQHPAAALAFASAKSPKGEGASYAGDAKGTVHFHFVFPHATTVTIAATDSATLGGQADASATHTPAVLQRHGDGEWWGTACYPVGPHPVRLMVDGHPILTPHLPVTCERNQALVNYIDVPPADGKRACWYAVRPRTERGSVAQDFVTSYTTDTVEDVLVYLPPSYHKASSATRRYPVLYLLHDASDQSMGAVQHGKVNIIADNLIEDGRMVEMIIVMKGCAQQHVRDDLADAHVLEQCDDLTEDIIPFIDNRYRTIADRDNRAIAGLSMGSMQASRLSITRPDLFAYAGVFSGFLRVCWSGLGANDDHVEALRRDPAAYQRAMKVFFRCIGDEDAHLPRFEEDDALLAELGVQCTRRIYKGPHSWHVWRQAAPDFLPILFKPHKK